MNEDSPIFEVVGEDGHEYRIWASGKIEGFGENAIVKNMIAPRLQNAQWLAKKMRDCGCLPVEQVARLGF